ncbi:MAG: hypothetical protein HOV83_02685 [Catenulispora sp.]|nr:hypothetical protein [Catenulispora sp.]
MLRTIAAGHPFHAPVALHAQGLYFVAPVLGMVLFLALMAAFTKPAPPPWQGEEQRSQVFFSSDNPYGFAGGAPQGNGGGPAQEQRPPQNGGSQAGGSQAGGSQNGGSQAGDATQQADPFRS